MAAIKDYTSQETPANPIDTSSEARARAGAGMHALGEGLTGAGAAFDTVQKFNDLQEGSKKTIQVGALQAKQQNDLELFRTTGNMADPEAIKAFLADREDEISKLADDVHSPTIRRHTAEMQQIMRDRLSTQTFADHQKAVGAMAVESIDYAQKSLSHASAADGGAYEANRDLIHVMVAMSGVAPNLAPKAEIELGKNVAGASIDGMIDRKEFDIARSDIESGRYDQDFNANEKMTWSRKIDSAEATERTLQNAARVATERQKKEVSDKAFDGYIREMFEPNFNLADWEKRMSHDGDLERAAKPELVRLLNENEAAIRARTTTGRAAETRIEAEQDKAVGTSVMQRILSPVGTPDRITDAKDIYAEVANGLSVPRANSLVASLNNLKTSEMKKDGFAAQYAEFHRRMRAELTLGSPQLEGEYADAMAYAEPIIQSGLTMGLTAGQMFDKDSPAYVLKGYQPKTLSEDVVLPSAPTKSFDRAALDKLPKGDAGKEKGIAALYDAVKAKQISPAEATQTAITHGWHISGSK